MHTLSKFHYREWPPPPALTRQLVCLWQLHITGNTDGQRPILPDGCVDLIWLNGATPLVAGPMDRAQHFPLPPGTTVLGARLRPGWAGVALGLPAAQLRNLHVPLADILRTSPLCTATQLTSTNLPALLQKYFVDIVGNSAKGPHLQSGQNSPLLTLPKGFMRIRHFGYLSNRTRRRKLAIIRRCLLQPPQPDISRVSPESQRCWPCPRCDEGLVRMVRQIPRFRIASVPTG